MWPRLAAALGGVAAAGAALYILASEAVAQHGWSIATWPMDTVLTVPAVLITIVMGHLAGVAFRRWRIVNGTLMLLCFCFGLTLTMLASVGRQSTQSETRHLNLEQRDKLRKDAEAQRKSNVALRDATQARMLRECPGYGQRHCKSLEDQVAWLNTAISGDQARLRELGPMEAEDQTGAKVAEVIRLLGGSAANVREAIDLLRPFMWSMFFEVASIICFGFAFHPSTHRVSTPFPPPPSTPGFPPPVSTPLPPQVSTPPSTPDVPPPSTPSKPKPRGHLRLIVTESTKGVETAEEQIGVELLASTPSFHPLPPPVSTPHVPPPVSTPFQRLVSIAVDGVLEGSQDTLAATLGFSNRTTLRNFLRKLQAEKKIQLSTSQKGTRIRIVGD